jgi:hypothetical protein
MNPVKRCFRWWFEATIENFSVDRSFPWRLSLYGVNEKDKKERALNIC